MFLHPADRGRGNHGRPGLERVISTIAHISAVMATADKGEPPPSGTCLKVRLDMHHSGRRESNPQQPAWKAGALAIELRPRLSLRMLPPGRIASQDVARSKGCVSSDEPAEPGAPGAPVAPVAPVAAMRHAAPVAPGVAMHHAAPFDVLSRLNCRRYCRGYCRGYYRGYCLTAPRGPMHGPETRPKDSAAQRS